MRLHPVLALRALAKSTIRRSVVLTSAKLIARNMLDARRFARGDIQTESGTLHDIFDAETSLQYIREVFDDYKHHGSIAHFHGDVAEIGPGDNCGVAMLAIADGARHVDLVDRYYSRRDARRQAEVYRCLKARYPAVATHFAEVDPENEATFPQLRRLYGTDAAAEVFFHRANAYDFILSRAVMEHLYDPIIALRRMATALRPGGSMLHKVDFTDHDMFSSHFHELTFLEIPDVIYRRMTRASGKPNRVLVHEYRAELERSGLRFELLVTRLAGVGAIEPHLHFHEIAPSLREKSLAFVKSRRRRFAASLQNVGDEDLAVAGIFIVARRAGDSASYGRA